MHLFSYVFCILYYNRQNQQHVLDLYLRVYRKCQMHVRSCVMSNEIYYKFENNIFNNTIYA